MIWRRLSCIFSMAIASSAEAAPGLSLADAVSGALTNNAAILIEKEEVKRAEGAVLVESGPFDFVVGSVIGHRREYIPYTPQIFGLDNVTQFRLGVSKQLPFGLVIEPSIVLYRRDSVIPAVVSGTVAPQNIAVLSLTLRQPLLRGGWATDASVDAAEKIAVAANHQARQIAAERVLAAVVAYWTFAGALRGVEASREAELRAEQTVKEGRELVAADQRPRADLEPLEATFADRTRARLIAEQQALEAKALLGLEMGLGSEEIDAIPPPSSAVPEPSGAIAALTPAEIEGALGRRDDLRAAEIRIESAEILVKAAQIGSLPQLDLQADVGYAGIVEGPELPRVFEPIAKNIPGVNVGASLLLRWPVESSAARGAMMQAVAERRRAQILRDDTARRARTELVVVHQNLRTSHSALERARQAQQHFRAAVENERIKLKSGHGTVLDVIVTEDRASAADLAEIAAHVAYARALAELAFARADLIRGEGDDVQVNLDPLVR